MCVFYHHKKFILLSLSDRDTESNLDTQRLNPPKPETQEEEAEVEEDNDSERVRVRLKKKQQHFIGLYM